MNDRLLIAALAAAGILGGCASGYRDNPPPVAVVVQPSSDHAITTTIKTAMRADDKLASRHIEVSTLNGQVELSGFTATQEEKDRAEYIARNATGVTGVRNDIDVQPPGN